MVQAYTWDAQKKIWKKRSCQRHTSFPQIACIHTVHPTAGEVVYLRLLLHHDHSRGKTSFAAMKVLANGTVLETYKETCMRLGLLQDNAEWHAAMNDAAHTAMCPQIRLMYIILLEFCNPADPIALFEQHWLQMADDFARKHPTAGADALRALVALDIEHLLRQKNKNLADFGIGQISPSVDMRRAVQGLDDASRIAMLPLLQRELMLYD